MGAMRMGNKHLSDTIQVCNWVIENTDSLHSKNIMARGLINRIQKFIHQTGRDKAISNRIKQDLKWQFCLMIKQLTMKNDKYRYAKAKRTDEKNRYRTEHDKETIVIRRIRCFSDQDKTRRRNQI